MSKPLQIKGEFMERKKLIAILLLLLLLLLIICTWCHSADILEKRTLAQKQVTTVTKQPINFKLTKLDSNFTLEGNFSTQESVTLLTKPLPSNYLQDFTQVNKELKHDPSVIELNQKLIPLFSKNYNEGSITYDNEQLIIEGSVNHQSDKDKIMTLLQGSDLKSINNTNVFIKKPISLSIYKNQEKISLDGTLDTEMNVNIISDSVQSPKLTNTLTSDVSHKSNDALITFLQKFIPLFETHYNEGEIHYKNEQLSIKGTTENPEAYQNIEALLAETTLQYVDHTEVLEPNTQNEELEALQKAKAEQAQKEAEAIAKAKAEQAQKEAEALAKAKALEKAKQIENELRETLSFENITFKLNKAELTAESLTTVQNIANILNKYPAVKIEIGGHTDDSGDDAYNLNLSQTRVNSVKDQLITLGITPERLNAVGYGETQPIISNDTQENRRKNRRVEFKVIGE